MTKEQPGRSGRGSRTALEHLREAAATASSHTILVVDDRPAGLYAASRMLQHAGYRTLEAATGEDAIRLARDASAVLLDVNLPDVNGVEVCRQMKQDASKLPVVLMSSVYTDHLHRDAGLASGADGYLTGPLVPEELASTFARLLA